MSTLEPNGTAGPDDPAEKTLTLHKAAELAMSGMSYRAIAEALNVNHDTIRRTLNSAEGQRLLREAREEYLERTSHLMSSLGMAALQTLGQALMSEETGWREKISAASKILDLGHRHTISIENMTSGTSVTVSLDDDLAWLRRRAESLREIETTATEVVEYEPPLASEG